MNNKRFIFNSLKVIFCVKIHINTLLKPIDCARFSSKMSSDDCARPTNSSKVLCPPAAVKEMTVFNKEAFAKEIAFPALVVECNLIKIVRKILCHNFVKLLELQPILEMPEKFIQKPGDSKCILLHPDIIPTFNSLEEPVRNKLKNYGVTNERFFYKKIFVTFDNWKTDDLVNAILPDGLRFSGYTIVGHIAHLNLREDLLKYKYVLGMIILKKNKNIKTVVNKLNIIDNTFRNFKMEIICGENDLVTTVRENYCFFDLDFSSVYWNSRLGTEHERVVENLCSGEVVYDVFAGVGPFSVPAAKKGCYVLANDLNPDSVKWLKKNVDKNRVSMSCKISNKDAKDFILQDIRDHILNGIEFQKNRLVNVHIIMNLPSLAVTFLEYFKGLFTQEESHKIPKYIYAYVYCFVKDKTTKDSTVLKQHAKDLIVSHLGEKALRCIKEVHEVRHVSVNKDMFRVTLKLGPEILVKGFLKRTAEMMEKDELCNDSNLCYQESKSEDFENVCSKIPTPVAEKHSAF